MYSYVDLFFECWGIPTPEIGDAKKLIRIYSRDRIKEFKQKEIPNLQN
jgi:hypothetical protein